MKQITKALLDALRYDPETGAFIWLIDRPAGIKAGDVAGGIAPDGYVYLKALGERYIAHRLAWAFVHGFFPSGHIDHRDGNRSNNAISNLRDVPRQINNENRVKPNKNNRSGTLGVRTRPCGTYAATIRIKGKDKHLGTYKTAELAHAAYVKAKRQLHLGNML